MINSVRKGIFTKGKLNIALLIVFLITASSILIGILTIFGSNASSQYPYLFILPFAFAFLNILFINIYSDFTKNYAIMIIIIVHFIRSVLSILILFFADYKSVFIARLIPNMYYNMPKTIILLVFELIAIYLGIYLAKRNKKKENPQTLDINKKLDYFSIVTFILVLIAILLWVSLPQIRVQYFTIFSKNMGSFSIEEQLSGNGFIRIISTLGIVLIETLKLFIPNYIIVILRKKIGQNKLGILLSLPMIFVQFLFITNTIMLSVVFALVSFFLLIRLYPKNKSTVFVILLCGIVLTTYTIFINKLFSSTGIETIQIVLLSDFVQAYFPGFQNLSGVLNISNGNRITSFMADIFYAVPFKNSISTIIGYDEFYNYYSTVLFNKSNGIYSQIIPFIGQMYYYFGIFAPVFSGFIAYKAVRLGYEVNKDSNIWLYVWRVYVLIILSVSTALYNMSIMLTLLVTPGMFYWVLVNLQSKYNKRIRKY